MKDGHSTGGNFASVIYQHIHEPFPQASVFVRDPLVSVSGISDRGVAGHELDLSPSSAAGK